MKYVGLMALLLLAPVSRGWANEASDEKKLEEKTKAIDANVSSPAQDPNRVKTLSDRYGVSQDRITQMRSSGMGWGGITTSLAMAEKYSQTTQGTTTPMTTDQALNRVMELRGQNMGWGKIAHELGFKLGPVVSSVRRSERALRTTDHKHPKHERTPKPDKPMHDHPKHEHGHGHNHKHK